MKPTEPYGLATWLFSLLLPQRDREMVLGDLLEEHALLASSLGPRDASRWYRNQLLRSVLPVLWATVRRGSLLSMLSTLGAACLGYLAVALFVMASDIAISQVLSSDELTYPLVSLIAGFFAMTLGGCLAAWMRPEAPSVLAVVSAIMAVVSLMVTGHRAPIWYQFALIVTPLAALMGGRIRTQKGEE